MTTIIMIIRKDAGKGGDVLVQSLLRAWQSTFMHRSRDRTGPLLGCLDYQGGLVLRMTPSVHKERKMGTAVNTRAAFLTPVHIGFDRPGLTGHIELFSIHVMETDKASFFTRDGTILGETQIGIRKLKRGLGVILDFDYDIIRGGRLGIIIPTEHFFHFRTADGQKLTLNIVPMILHQRE